MLNVLMNIQRMKQQKKNEKYIYYTTLVILSLSMYFKDILIVSN